jgi:mannose-6-phosphate isomerase-like protein (cupin superfamily)
MTAWKGSSRVTDIGPADQRVEARLHGGLIRETVRWHEEGPTPRGPGLSLGLSAYRIQAGERCTVHVHQGKVETWFFMSGHAEVTRGDQVLIVTSGDAVQTPPGTPHGIRALGDEPVRFLNIVEYIEGAEVTTVEMEEPDVEKPA